MSFFHYIFLKRDCLTIYITDSLLLILTQVIIPRQWSSNSTVE